MTFNWSNELADRLTPMVPCGYQSGSEPAAEPTAWAGLALVNNRHVEPARRAGGWLAELQNGDGSVGIDAQHAQPGWPTGLAVMLWERLREQTGSSEFDTPLERGVEWILNTSGKTSPQKTKIGHDTTLAGWSWAAGTHSWLEPTAFAVLALKEVGLAEHPRTREGVRVLIDRLLPDGGCNYGNTTTLGQTLFPHVQPTGLVMWALGNEPSNDRRIALSLDYLERELQAGLATTSLSFGLQGLAAHDRIPREKLPWLKAAYERELKRGASPQKLALILLAVAGIS